MKKWIKRCLVAVILIAVIGFVLPAVSGEGERGEGFFTQMSGGFSVWLEKLGDLGERGKKLFEDVKEEGDKLLDSMSEGYNGLEGYDIEDAMFFDKDEPVESGNADRIFENMNASSLYVELGGCVLEIMDAEDDTVRVVIENAGKFQVHEKDEELRIKATRKAKEDAKDCRIILYLPQGYGWQQVHMEVGAGIIRMDGANTSGMTAVKMNMKVGAGQILAQGLHVSELGVDLGAGEIRMDKVEAGCLEASIDAGKFSARGTVGDSVKAKCSMGNLELELAGSETDYDYDLECVAGNIQIGEEKYGGTATEQKIANGTGRVIDLQCSMGNIKVSFAK